MRERKFKAAARFGQIPIDERFIFNAAKQALGQGKVDRAAGIVEGYFPSAKNAEQFCAGYARNTPSLNSRLAKRRLGNDDGLTDPGPAAEEG